jgi:hypothetical protein
MTAPQEGQHEAADDDIGHWKIATNLFVPRTGHLRLASFRSIEIADRHLIEPGKLLQFHKIDPTLTRFTLGHERLRLT